MDLTPQDFQPPADCYGDGRHHGIGDGKGIGDGWGDLDGDGCTLSNRELHLVPNLYDLRTMVIQAKIVL